MDGDSLSVEVRRSERDRTRVNYREIQNGVQKSVVGTETATLNRKMSSNLEENDDSGSDQEIIFSNQEAAKQHASECAESKILASDNSDSILSTSTISASAEQQDAVVVPSADQHADQCLVADILSTSTMGALAEQKDPVVAQPTDCSAHFHSPESLSSLKHRLDDLRTISPYYREEANMNHGEDTKDYEAFKIFVNEELFLMKEMMIQKFETLELSQGLTNASTDSKNDNHQRELSHLRNENESLLNELSNMKLLKYELAYLRQADDANKKLIIQLVEKVSHGLKESEVPAPVKNTGGNASNWTIPKNPVNQQKQKRATQIQFHDTSFKNSFAPLSYGSSSLVENETSISESNVVSVTPDTLYTDTVSVGVTTKVAQEKKHRRGLFFDKKTENNVIRSYRNEHSRTMPGASSYSDITKRGKKILVAGDSMIKWVKGKVVSREVERGRVDVNSFVGATAKELKDFHIQPLLKKKDLDAVVIMVGTNSIPAQRTWENGVLVKTQQSVDEIAKEILDVGIECRRQGVNDIFINGVVHRDIDKDKNWHHRNEKARYNERIQKVNDILEAKCVDLGYTFISNDFLDNSFISDGTHFSAIGTTAFTNNLSSCINYFYSTT